MVPCEVAFTNSSENASSYMWDFGDGETSTERSPRHTFRSANTFQVKLVAKGDGGSQGTTKTVTTRAPLPPVVDFNIANNGCTAPCTVSFTNQTTNAITYEWTFGDNTSSTQTNPTKLYNSAGTYRVKLTANGGGGSRSVEKTVTIAAPAEAPVAAFSISNNGCTAPCTVSFTNQSSNASSYEWTFGDNTSSTQTSPTKQYNQAGSYTVRLTANGQGGSSSTEKTVTVFAPAAAVAAFSASNNGCTAPCTVNFTNQSSNANSYEWNFGDNTTSTQPNPTKQYTKAGNYVVKLTATGQGGSHSTEQTINIAAPAAAPVAAFNINNNGCTAPCDVSFSNQSSNANTFEWSFGDNTTSTQKDPTKRYSQAGTYTVKLTANGEGGTNSTEKSVTISAPAAAPVAIFSINNNGCTAPCTVSFSNQSSNATSYEWSFGDNTSSTQPSPMKQYSQAGNYTVRLTATGPGGSNSSQQTVTINSPAALEPTKQWDKTFGGSAYDEAKSILNTSDGGYLLFGHSNSGSSGDKSEGSKGNNDYWVVKINGSGNRQWDKTIGGNGSDDARAVVPTADGGYLLVGLSESTVSWDKSEGSRGGNDFWIVKINSSGTKVWDKTYGGSGYDEASSVVPTSDGGFVILGYSYSNQSSDKAENARGEGDYWVMKINSSGSVLWEKTLGGSGNDVARSIVATSDGGFLLVGNSTSPAGGDKSQGSQGNYDIWVVKINGSGAKQWDRTFGGNGIDDARHVVATSDGGAVLAGLTESGRSGDKSESSRGGYDYWVIKLNSSGGKVWDKTLGGSGNDYARSVASTSDGGFVVTGFSDSGQSGDRSDNSKGQNDYWLVKVDANGGKVWDKAYGSNGNDSAEAILSTSDGGYIMAGHSNSGASGDKSEGSHGNSDYWVLKVK
ncbi:hypothetical protein GCM10027291_19580 [Telluribacter humicola]